VIQEQIMGFAQRRIVRVLAAVGAVCGVGSSAPARAEPAQHSGQHCQADALEKWYCAADPRGSAVVDSLGRVVCAPGACVKQDTQDTKEEWLCSSEPGGRATAVPEGAPTCDGRCRPPEATACKQR
jgi:hypothetical protein